MTSLWVVLILVSVAFALWGTLIAADKIRSLNAPAPSIGGLRVPRFSLPRARALLMLIGLCLLAGGWAQKSIIEAETGFMQGEFGNRLGAYRWLGEPLGSFQIGSSLRDEYARWTYIQAAGAVLFIASVPWGPLVERLSSTRDPDN